MIDFGYFKKERPYYQLLGEKLRPGDISTTIFRGPTPWFDAEGKVLPYLHEARRGGVILDVGHGGGSFCFRNAVPAIAQGFYPDSISTDLHALCMNMGMLDMATTMSKFLVMGMPLGEVIRASTINPAREIGHPEVGAPVGGCRGRCGGFAADGGKFWLRRFFRRPVGRPPAAVLRADGQGWRSGLGLEWPSGIAYPELGESYGIREGEYLVLPPE